MKTFKSFMHGSQAKAPINEAKFFSNFFCSICSSNDHLKEFSQISGHVSAFVSPNEA